MSNPNILHLKKCNISKICKIILISVLSITKNGGSVTFNGEKCEVSPQESRVAVGHKEGNLFVLDFDKDISHTNANTANSTGNQSLELWNLHLGHLGYD